MCIVGNDFQVHGNAVSISSSVRAVCVMTFLGNTRVVDTYAGFCLRAADAKVVGEEQHSFNGISVSANI